MYVKAIGPQQLKLYTLEMFAGEYFYKSHSESMQYKTLHVKHIDKLFKNLLIVLPMILLSHGICVAAPLYAILFQHIRTTPAGIHLPYFEKDSNLEYTLNMILQTIMAFYLITGDLAIEMASCAINNSIVLIPDLIQYNLNEFQAELKTNGIHIKSIAQLRNVFLQIQDFNWFVKPQTLFVLLIYFNGFEFGFFFCLFCSYILEVIDIFYDKLSICPIIWSFSIILSIFAEIVVKNLCFNYFFKQIRFSRLWE